MNNKGTAFIQLKKYAEAIKCINKAVQINPNYADAFSGRAVCKVKKGDIDSGLADLDKSIKMDKEKYMDLAKQDESLQTIDK